MALGVAGLALGIGVAADRRQLLFTVGVLGVMSVVYPTAGAFIAARRPRNVIGWLLLAAGLSMAVVALAGAYGMYGRASGDSLPGAGFAAWLASWVFVPALALAGAFLLLLFPTGAPPGPRWRPVVVAIAIAAAAVAVGYAFRPGDLALGVPIENPFGFSPAGSVLTLLADAGDVLFPVALVVAAASMVVRYRDAGPDTRLQLKWFAYAATAMVTALALATLPFEPLMLLGWAVGAVALAALPVTVAIAVLKHRLYDIDFIINRTLVYVVLVAILGGLYTASITFFQRLFVALTGNTSDAAIVITALILAGGLTPIRKGLEGTVDRRFKPHDAEEGPAPAAGVARQSALDQDAAASVHRRLDGMEGRLAALESTADRATRKHRVEVLWSNGCPHYHEAREMLVEVVAAGAPGTPVHDVDATDPAVAAWVRFPGSPTIRIDGRDVDPSYSDSGDYTPRCRLYRTSRGLSGVPEREWLVAALSERS